MGCNARQRKLLLFCDADDCASRTWVARLVRASPTDGAFLGGSLDLLKLKTARQRSWYGGRHEPSRRATVGRLPRVGDLGELRRDDPSSLAKLGPFDTQYLGAGDDIAVSWRATMLGQPPPSRCPTRSCTTGCAPRGLAAWKHQCVYGRRQVTLYRQFASHGLPPTPLAHRAGVRGGTPLRSTREPLLCRSKQRRAALRSLAYEVGRVIGSVEERTLYL